MTTIYIRNYDTFCQIANEIKTTELRKKSKFISQLLCGQTVQFVHKHEIIRCYIKCILHDTFNKIIKKINIHTLNKHIKSEKDAIDLYSSYYHNFDTVTDFIAISFTKITP
jgi:ASC-1-like (ASCH) protein